MALVVSSSSTMRSICRSPFLSGKRCSASASKVALAIALLSSHWELDGDIHMLPNGTSMAASMLSEAHIEPSLSITN
uniref:Uncharacterized protein n=1 Tax=Oryza sativa subsp. japonica TaxID=39947 RepID=Q10RQ8_ORYSJ|nr:hypothetical protein LOC_Os03g05550 [Oryza sativa Japonica Group]